MTVDWFLTCHGGRAELSPEVVLTRARELAGNPLACSGLWKRKLDGVVLYEPLTDRTAMASVYAGRPRRRQELEEALGWTALALMESGGVVGFFRAHADEAWPAPERQVPEPHLVAAVMSMVRRQEVGWWEVHFESVRFGYVDVEVRPFAPDSSLCFEDFEVVAQSASGAEAELRAAAAASGVWPVSIPAPRVLGLGATRSSQGSGARGD